MAQTKVKLISDGVIDVNHLASGHSITTDNIGEGSNLYYTDARVSTYLSTNNYATEGYVTTAVANLVDAAPTTLDTLNELAAALGDDPNFATTVTNSIATKLPLAGGNITGTLGIGAATQVRKLHVDGGSISADTPTIRISSTDSSGTNKFGIEFYSNNGADVRGKILADNNGRVYIDDNGGGGVVLQANGGSGNVGIGTTSPDSKLQIANANGSSYRFGYAGTSDVYIDSRVTYFRTANGNINNVTIDADGNVLIGTTNKIVNYGRELVVDGTNVPTQPEGFLAIKGQRVSGNVGGLTFYNGNEQVSAIISQAQGNLRFLTGTNTANSLEAMRIDSDGNVGIGQQNDPEYKLDVRSSTVAGSFIAGNGGYTALRFDGDSGATIGSITTNAGSILIGSENSPGTGSNGEILIKPYAGHVLYLDSSRNVGIGGLPNAWNLGRTLQLSGDNAAVSFGGNSAIFGIVNGYYDGGNYRTINTGTVASFEYSLSVSNAFSWRTEGANPAGTAIDLTAKMVLTNDGKLGIGTVTPGHKFVVREDSGVNNENYVHFERRTGGESSYDATGLRIVSLAKNNTGKSGISYIGFDTRSSALNGSHGSNGFITLTPGAGSAFGDGQFDFFLRNNNAPFTFNNDPSVTSNYWQNSLMTITSSGHILKPQQPAFHVRRAATGTVPHGSFITYDTAYFNRGNHYNVSNGVFTAPISGVYFFFWSAIGNNSIDVYRYYIYLNDSRYSWQNGGGDIHLRQDTNFTHLGNGNGYATNGYRIHVAELSANDQVRIYFESDGNTPSYSGSDYLTFGGYLIG